MNDINEMPPKCQYCPYWEICEYPWVCPDRKQLATKLQQTCHATDTISRQAAIEAVHKNYDTILDFKTDGKTISSSIEDILSNLPPAQFEKRWIPCSERLPDRFGKMLVTFIPRTLWTYVIIANYSDLMGIAKPCFWIGNVGKDDFANITSQVVAWMPLPEPYKEDDHD